MGITVVVLTLLALAYVLYLCSHNKKTYLRGLWYMTPEFCTSGGVDSTVMVVGNDEVVVKVSSNGQIAESKFKYSLSESLVSMFHPYKASYTLYPSEDNELEYPKNMTCEMDICAGTMCWYVDDLEYADLRKVFV